MITFHNDIYDLLKQGKIIGTEDELSRLSDEDIMIMYDRGFNSGIDYCVQTMQYIQEAYKIAYEEHSNEKNTMIKMLNQKNFVIEGLRGLVDNQEVIIENCKNIIDIQKRIIELYRKKVETLSCDPINTKEVYFSEFCQTCKFADKSEQDDPCEECMNNPVNENSHKPVNYKEAD